MAFEAKIILDSITEVGDRLTTFEVTYPRIVHAEFMTHRVFSRNSASSRAIPVQKMIAKVIDDPFIPVYWGKNQKGMQAHLELPDDEKIIAQNMWLSYRDNAVKQASSLLQLGVHKQITNRLLEPFMWHTVIVTGTEWANFFALRSHPDAQPEIKKISDMMEEVYHKSNPKELSYSEWHRPFMFDDVEGSELKLNLVSTGRCARVSYLTHDGIRDPEADYNLASKLKISGHMSPFEHVARPMLPVEYTSSDLRSNFKGWVQFRKLQPFENDFSKVRAKI